MATTNKMQIHGENMTSVTIIEKILLSMTPKFNYVVRSIKQLKEIEELSIDELHGSMLVYKQKFFQEDKDEQALKASTNNNAVTPNKSTDRGRGRGRGGEENGDGGRGGSGNFRDDKDQFDFETKGRGRNQQYDKSKVELDVINSVTIILNVILNCLTIKEMEKNQILQKRKKWKHVDHRSSQ